MRELVTSHPCACSAEEFWALREDLEWDHYNAGLDGQIFSTLKHELIMDEERGEAKVHRSHQLKAKVNPIPKAIRSILGAGDFIVTVHAQWYKRLYSKADAMTLRVQTPLFTERIHIHGEQWTEAVDAHNCVLKTRMTISVKVPGPGIGPKIEKGTEKGMREAYADQPRRVVEFLRLRAASGRPYPDPFKTLPAPLPSLGSFSLPTAESAAGDVSHSAAVAAAILVPSSPLRSVPPSPYLH